MVNQNLAVLIFIFLSVTTLFLSASANQLSFDNDSEVAHILVENPTLIYLGQAEGKRFFFNGESRTWYDSDRFCKEIGMNLVSVQTEVQYEFLRTATYPPTTIAFWTSGRDSENRANYKWSNGEQFGDFGDWRESVYPPGCVYMSPGKFSGYFRDYQCNYGNLAVCEL